MISIGAVYNGPELQGSKINRLIMATSKAVKELRGTLGQTPWVNVVFVVPGSLGGADFDDLKYGDYSKKDKAVVVQIPMPKNVAEGTADQVGFIIDALRGANAMAFEFFRQHDEKFPLREAEILVGEVAERVELA
jgi:hypothetical protein